MTNILDTTANKFIGQGLIFPIQLNENGRPDIVGGKELIQASFVAILSTYLGTRFFLGEFGSKIEDLLQEPNDLITEVLAKEFTSQAINIWDNRVIIDSVTTDKPSDNKLNIRISYRILNTKIEDTFIFPYYSQLIY